MIYKIIVDKQPLTNPSDEKREYDIDIEELRFKGNVYDSLVITASEDYVIRRLQLSEFYVLTVLDEPIKEPLKDINIELFQGENYIYLYDMEGNRLVGKYLVNNEFNQLYVTRSEMTSTIAQSVNAIELSVNAQFEGIDGEINDITGKLELKIDKDDNDQVVSMINASANEINLKSNRLSIESNNFNLATDGTIQATAGEIGGFDLSSTEFSGGIDGIYNYDDYDLFIANSIVLDLINESSNYEDIFDVDGSGSVTITDISAIRSIIEGTVTSTKNVTGSFIINSQDPKKCIVISKGYEPIVEMGVAGINTKALNASNILCGYANGVNANGVIIDGDDARIYVTQNSGNQTVIDTTGIVTPQVTQTSLETEKKNFEKLENGLDIVNNTEIYKYNMKFENDEDKKHIGFVIGDDFKYRKEITSNGNDGVDLYSMIAVAYKAIQEQQKEIEMLKTKIENLEKGDKKC